MKSTITKEYLLKRYCQDFWTHEEMAKELGVWTHTVQRACKRHGIKGVRRLQGFRYKEDFFKTWSADMAYILAFITCDGFIQEEPKRFAKWLGIEVAKFDVHILEFIRSKICPTSAIRYRKRTFKSGSKTSLAMIKMGNRPLVDSLIGLGVVPRKTGKEVLPEIPIEFQPDYLRGLLDGDGCLSISTITSPSGKSYKAPRLQWTCACRKFLEDVKEKLLNGMGTIVKPKNQNCYVLRVGARAHIIKILSWAYNGNYCFERKRAKFLELLEYDRSMAKVA